MTKSLAVDRPVDASQTLTNDKQTLTMIKRPLRYVPIVLFFSIILSTDALAQVQGHSIGLGGQVGDPSGITLKVYQNRGFAYDFLAAWDWDDYFLFNVHGLFERPLQNTPMNYYLGPGAFVIIKERRDDDILLGISGNFGINFFIERFEVFLQITPRLSVVPDTDGDVGGGVGLRYYF